jgi:YfiH family protein
MPFHQPDSIRYFTFDLLEEAQVIHAAITRRGGLSPKPWSSLNVGGTVGDDSARVFENRRRTFQALGRPFESLYDVWQVHGKRVVHAHAPRPPDMPHLKADAILTDRPGVTLFMRFADCVPIFLYDPVRNVIGLVHAGWQGTVNRVATEAVQAMHDRYGVRPAHILAGIGPSIGPHHYQVGPDVIQKVKESFGVDASDLLSPVEKEKNDHVVQLFDLWKSNRLILEQAGVREIEVCSLCTACHLDDWYSHRGEKGQTGRFGALIAL